MHKYSEKYMILNSSLGFTAISDLSIILRIRGECTIQQEVQAAMHAPQCDTIVKQISTGTFLLFRGV
jgi:hypothetical protein